ncbi:hypothetical protein [Planotetraspora sp. GP83]|uniref:hypothetical protein n=1 Tax=Planotetraspora sp. GP83 TaxID=3156264 RepID=UPI0035151241
MPGSRGVTPDPPDSREPSHAPLTVLLIFLSLVLAIMPVRRVVIEIGELGLAEVVGPLLVLLGVPALGALAGASARIGGRGGRLLGIAIGLFVAGLILMILLACWFPYAMLSLD